MNICWKNKVTNATVTDKVNRWKTAVDYVKERKLQLSGYICQMSDRHVNTLTMGR